MSMHANEEMLAGNFDAYADYPDTDPDATLFEYRLCCYWVFLSELCPCAVRNSAKI